MMKIIFLIDQKKTFRSNFQNQIILLKLD